MSLCYQWRLFGTREQGQSTLHDGELTLTKKLDGASHRAGARRGRHAEAGQARGGIQHLDEPDGEWGQSRIRREGGWMGSTYGASYDATEKALVFDGTDDYVSDVGLEI